MRAIEALELTAHRDNKNQWRIDEEALVQWAHSERDQPDAHQAAQVTPPETPQNNMALELAQIKELLEAEKRRADIAEKALTNTELDRDRWYQLAMKPWWKRVIG